ncbi:hypothetical protein H5407_09345 [Mitsuaria sp. WAJ17]|uniref:hypothetical protein n=1 Tax=Mitsuaria sp. WAJ17 TaxID=2761452 RepID=UPI0016039A93|nr:hypothetical protein [Mitsuaria sp. WAJ17]MBB2485431.1 hypothetical protein [Mitsuaria sp. WAJ17]
MTDHAILCKKGRYSILAKSHELPLRDGSITKLHLVQEQGQEEPARFLRAIANDVAGTFVFDVRDLARCLDLEIRQLPARDTLGVITLTLRQFYTNAAALRCKIIEQCLVSFRDVMDQQVAA